MAGKQLSCTHSVIRKESDLVSTFCGRVFDGFQIERVGDREEEKHLRKTSV
jgi:hypothetical protein